MCISHRINNIAKSANSANIGIRETEFVSSDGGDDGENNGVGFVEISK